MLSLIFIIWIVFLVYVSHVSIKKFGFVTNHYLLTNAYWALCLYISIYQNYYIHPVSNIIYYIFFTGSFFFNLTLFTSKIERIPGSFNANVSYSLKRRRLLELFVLAVVLPLAYTNAKAIIAGGEIWRLYAEIHEARSTNDYLDELLKQNIVQPLTYVLMATCLYANYKAEKKIKLSPLIIGVILAVLNLFMTAGGRTGLMQFCFFLFLSYVASHYFKSDNLIKKIDKKTVFLVSFVAIFAFAFATIGREGDNVLDVIFERISLPPALFEGYYLQTDICDGYTWGTSMFESPISFLLYPFKMLGFDATFERIGPIISAGHWTPATESVHNAAVSPYLYYMRDFGIWGVAIGPYIVGKIYNWLWKYCRKDSFLIVFYFSGVCSTCLETSYPFARGYFFGILYVFLVRKFLLIKK